MGLTQPEIKLCYQNNPLNEEEAIQDGLHKWKETHGDCCTWQVLLGAMKFAGIAQQHCSELVEELHQRMQCEWVTFPSDMHSAVVIRCSTFHVACMCNCISLLLVDNDLSTHQTTAASSYQEVTCINVFTNEH